MARLSLHYERAFQAFLLARRIPFVAVSEARKALAPAAAPPGAPEGLKSFDFVLYGRPLNLLADVKGRKVPPTRRPGGRARLESWVTAEDVRSLDQWERLFGPGFAGAFVFAYWCPDQPPDGLFQEVFAFEGAWYALRAVLLADYRSRMRPRSARWGTVDLPAAEFTTLSHPLSPDCLAGASRAG